jgi:ATP-binding cassette, subfamily F, member 3
MIYLNGIRFGFGGQMLMDGVSLHVRPGDRIGLVGPNGAGKTTLLRIIKGDIEGFEGTASRRKGLTVGLLPQEGIYDSGRTVFEAALEPFNDLIAMEREIAELNSASEHASESEQEELLLRAGGLQHEFESRGGFSFRARTAEVLGGLGFSNEDRQREISTLSGGWQMRVALARLLLQNPDVLLLDEPTNHLDLPALIWFEEFLQGYSGSVVLVSHDRAFLDRLARRIAEFSRHKLELYNGNYSFHEIEKAKRREILMNKIANQEREIRHIERFVERFRYKNTKARSVQSRIKMLDKMERIEAPDETHSLKFKFTANFKSGKTVMQLQNITKSYGEKTVLRDVGMTINRGDRIAIVGANGLGKTTLMRVIAGRTEFDGDRKPGHNVTINYFSQDQYELLNPDKTVLEEASGACGTDFKGSVRTILGVFLFYGDNVDKKVRVLSGGEKSRLLLAKLMINPTNFLLLDEPTNHLDPPSRDMLERVLDDYDGTLCFVSHDRWFINALANRIIEITPGGMEEFIGNYEDFKEQKKLREKCGGGEGEAESELHNREDSESRRSVRRNRAKLVLDRGRALAPMKDKITRAETRIAELETRIMELESVLADPSTYSDPEKARVLPAELKSARVDLEQQLSLWESLSEKISEKEKEFEPENS